MAEDTVEHHVRWHRIDATRVSSVRYELTGHPRCLRHRCR
jgi:hypothetical protein